MKTMKWMSKNKQTIWTYGLPVLVFIIVVMMAVIPQTKTPYNPIAIDLGFAQVAWYAVFILTGISLGAFLTYQEFKKVGWNPDILFDGLLYAVPLAIVGARVYDVIFKFDRYSNFLEMLGYVPGRGISLEGLSIHGAVIATFIFLIFFTRKKKISFWLLADMLAVGFLVGQIIGRWGNFMNHELYGPAIESPWLIELLPGFIRNQMVVYGVVHHPTFLYEGLWNFIGLVFLLVARRKKWFRVGDMLGLYLIWYGLGRGLIIEPLRALGAPGDVYIIFGNIPLNIIVSLGVFSLGGLLLIFLKNKWVQSIPYYVDMLVKSDD